MGKFALCEVLVYQRTYASPCQGRWLKSLISAGGVVSPPVTCGDSPLIRGGQISAPQNLKFLEKCKFENTGNNKKHPGGRYFVKKLSPTAFILAK